MGQPRLFFCEIGDRDNLRWYPWSWEPEARISWHRYCFLFSRTHRHSLFLSQPHKLCTNQCGRNTEWFAERFRALCCSCDQYLDQRGLWHRPLCANWQNQSHVAQVNNLQDIPIPHQHSFLLSWKTFMYHNLVSWLLYSRTRVYRHYHGCGGCQCT